MSYYYGKAADKPGNTYRCNCVDGKCSGCGGCCTDMLPLTAKELQRIKIYAREHNLQEHRQAPFFDPGAFDLTCPFRNEPEQRCDIYPVRPKICRNFICSKPRPVVLAERDRITGRAQDIFAAVGDIWQSGSAGLSGTHQAAGIAEEPDN